jgi:hypothetical protein
MSTMHAKFFCSGRSKDCTDQQKNAPPPIPYILIQNFSHTLLLCSIPRLSN